MEIGVTEGCRVVAVGVDCPAFDGVSAFGGFAVAAEQEAAIAAKSRYEVRRARPLITLPSPARSLVESGYMDNR